MKAYRVRVIFNLFYSVANRHSTAEMTYPFLTNMYVTLVLPVNLMAMLALECVNLI